MLKTEPKVVRHKDIKAHVVGLSHTHINTHGKLRLCGSMMGSELNLSCSEVIDLLNREATKEFL